MMMSEIPGMGEEYDEEEYLEELKNNQLTAEQQELSQIGDKPIKVLIKRKFTVITKWGNERERWTVIGRKIIVPGTVQNEKRFCFFILMEFGEGEYLVSCWRKYLPLFQTKKRKKKPIGFATFWRGLITKQGYIRHGGSMQGVIRSTNPTNQIHQWR